jgi:hypothetical protein
VAGEFDLGLLDVDTSRTLENLLRCQNAATQQVGEMAYLNNSAVSL